MSTQTYKCPSCGAGIEFKPDLGKFKCDYCLSEFTQEQMSKIYAAEDARNEAKAQVEQARADATGKQTEETIYGYHCDNCGATVETDETTTATFCYYCHNPVIISSRLAGRLRPAQMIPFRFSKDEAQKKFLDWVGKKRYVCKDFISDSSLEKMTGLYLPYWYVDIHADFSYVGNATRERSWTTGNRRYVETSYYKVFRDGYMFIDDLNLAAYSKFDNDLIYGIMPYDNKNIIPFAQPYLSGFFAESYDRDENETEPQMHALADKVVQDIVERSIRNYNTNSRESFTNYIKYDPWLYTLLPLWVLTYKYRDKMYIYAMNGESGKTYGEIPMNKGLLTLHAFLIGIILTAILLVLGYFI